MLRKLIRNRKGQGLVEYGLLVSGIAVISLAAVSTIGHKTGDLLGLAAVMLPGAHTDDNAPLASGHLIETDNNGGSSGSALEASPAGVLAASNGTVDRLGQNVFGNSGNGNGINGLIVETD